MGEACVLGKEELRKYSGEHLYYEIWMFYGTVFRLLRGERDQVVANTLLEAFVLHGAILIDFFFNKKDKSDDAVAVDFGVDRSEWKKFISAYNRDRDYLIRRRHKEIAHLSYLRQNVGEEEKQWRYFHIADRIATVIDRFIEMADPTILHEQVLGLRGCFYADATVQYLKKNSEK